jgi:hypothetical protein
VRSPNQREWVLLGLLAVVLLGMLYLRSGGIGGGAGARSGGAAPELGEVPQVHLDWLSQPAEQYDPQGRNLFAYGPPPSTGRATPPPPPQRQPPPRIERPPRVEPPPQRQPQPARATGPQPPKPSFKYLGYLGPKDNRIAVFEPGGTEKQMLLAGAGDVVEREFRVVEFKYEVVVLGYTDSRFAGQTTEITIEGKNK